MKNLLLRENREVLAQLAGSRVLLGFDFDGTLAPIVEDRECASMRTRTAELLGRLCRLYPCAVISGRSKSDVEGRLGSAELKYVVGNHGLEPGSGLLEFEQEVAEAYVLLKEALAQCAGVDIENKRYTLALHYRRSRQKRQARQAIDRAVGALPSPMRSVLGKMVVNLVPERAPNKGTALLELRAMAGADTALYVGDDVTDEDVFELDQPGRLLSLRVGESQASSAGYFLRDQRAIDELLQTLILLRSNTAG